MRLFFAIFAFFCGYSMFAGRFEAVTIENRSRFLATEKLEVIPSGAVSAAVFGKNQGLLQRRIEFGIYWDVTTHISERRRI